MVLADSPQITGVRGYSGYHSRETMRFHLPDSHRLRSTFPSRWANTQFSYSPTIQQNDPNSPTTPHTQRLPAITRTWFTLIRFRSPLLTESLLFSSPAGTEMFHFPAFPPTVLYIQTAVTPHDGCRVTPFGHPRIKARLTAPRGLSRPPTSFIGS